MSCTFKFPAAVYGGVTTESSGPKQTQKIPNVPAWQHAQYEVIKFV